MIDGNEGNNDITSHAREKTIEQWLHEGIESFDSKRYHEALAAYEHVIWRRRDKLRHMSSGPVPFASGVSAL